MLTFLGAGMLYVNHKPRRQKFIIVWMQYILVKANVKLQSFGPKHCNLNSFFQRQLKSYIKKKPVPLPSYGVCVDDIWFSQKQKASKWKYPLCQLRCGGISQHSQTRTTLGENSYIFCRWRVVPRCCNHYVYFSLFRHTVMSFGTIKYPKGNIAQAPARKARQL